MNEATLDTVETRHGIRMLLCAADGPRLTVEQDAVDMIAEALSQRVELLVLPVARLDERFFSLRSSFAGQILQKFVQYRRRLVILGDISTYVGASNALRDFVTETNRGREVWFLRDIAELDARIARTG